MRIATWNLERTSPSKPTWQAIQEQLHSVDADIWLLTESNSNLTFSLDQSTWHSVSINSYHVDGECRTSICTKYAVREQVRTHDKETALCVEIETPAGLTLVYGTVIPYADAGIVKPYLSNGQWSSAKKWELHYKSLSQHRDNLLELRALYPNHHFVFGGDLNQNRDGTNWYGTTKGRELLTKCLADANLQCVTEADFRALGQLTTRAAVDHICLSPLLAALGPQVEAWEAPLLNGKPISDHNGITVDFDLTTF